jgi:DNA-binding transcriptional LysR family regulator
VTWRIVCRSVEPARAGDPFDWIGVKLLAVRRAGLICLGWRARRGPRPRSSWAGPHEAERNGSEQCPLWTTRWQLDADAGNVLDHARANLDQALSDCRELAVSTARFITVLPKSMFDVLAKGLSVKSLPVRLPTKRRPIAVVVSKNRTLSPMAKLFIETVRSVAKLPKTKEEHPISLRR